MLTPATLARCWPRCPQDLLADLARSLAGDMARAGIVTVTRAACFLGQLAWECDEARLLEEPADKARAYEGRRDLGNLHPGDGVAFRGRGLIQLTGRANYRRAGLAIAHDLESHPERVAEDLGIAAAVAAWFWVEHGCNALADALEERAITQAINGKATDGPPSYHERRMERVRRAALALGSGARLVDDLAGIGLPEQEPEGGGSVRA